MTHGTFAALFSGDRNQHGEPYGTQLIDAQIGGGGASAIADGIDQSGAPTAPRPHIANVESNELHGPMLFLYRAFFPDTGGDGALRGGRAAGTAWTPHGVDRLRNSVTAHGVEVPVLTCTGVSRNPAAVPVPFAPPVVYGPYLLVEVLKDTQVPDGRKPFG